MDIKYCQNVLCSARCLWQIPAIHPDGKPDCADWDPYPVSPRELWQSPARELWADDESEMVRQLSLIPYLTGIQNTVPFHNQETCFFRSTAKLQSFQSALQIVFFWVVNSTMTPYNSSRMSEPESWCVLAKQGWPSWHLEAVVSDCQTLSIPLYHLISLTLYLNYSFKLFI